MPLSLTEQLDLGIKSITYGDVDLLSRLMTDPGLVSLDEQRTAAEKLGVKKGLLSAFVNMAADPTVWLAALMSRRFPTESWLKGTVPQRFIGLSNEFSGISLVARPIESFFRGTHIPKLTALSERRTMEVMQVGRKIFDLIDSRPNWAQEKEAVSLLMEGQNVASGSPELGRVAGELRGHMNELWGFLNRTHHVEGGFTGDEIVRASARPFTSAEAPKYLRDYLPHMPLLVDESVVTISGKDAIKRLSRTKEAQAAKLKGERFDGVWSANESDRASSDFIRYQQFLNNVGTEVFTPSLFMRKRHDIPIMSAQGQELFVTDLDVILKKYVHSVAKTFAVNAPLSEHERMLAAIPVLDEITGQTRMELPTADPIAVQVMNIGLGTTGAQYNRSKIAGTEYMKESVRPNTYTNATMSSLKSLMRQLQGQSSEDEIVWGNVFSGIRNRVHEYVNIHGGADNKALAHIDNALTTFEKNTNYRKISSGVASFFYTTTLGANPWSAIQNMFQPVLTTAPAIGIGATVAGYRELGRRLPKYSANFNKHWGDIKQRFGVKGIARFNEAIEGAFRDTFPELGAQGIRIDPRNFEIDQTVMQSLLQGGGFKKVEQIQKLLLQPFTQAELSNQVVSFYGAKSAILKAAKNGTYQVPSGLRGSEIDDYVNFDASQVVGATQFRPGPGGRTVLQNFLPAFMRQFTSFPIRLGSFLVDSTVRGAMTVDQLRNAPFLDKVLTLGTGRNVGTIARTFLYGKMLTHGMRDVLGIDIGRAVGLLTPFDLAPSGQPFSPLPLPPVASMLYSVGSYTASRDVKDLQPLILPGVGEVPLPKTLVPGGIAATRLFRAMNQFRPDLGGFVDDDERLMWQGDATDFWMAALGVPLDKQRRSRETVERLQDFRTKTRTMRREFTLATINADTGAQRRLRNQWQEAYPDMPPLTVSDMDLDRYRSLQRMTVVQRMLQTIGSQAKFLENDVFTYDPDLFAQGYAPGSVANN